MHGRVLHFGNIESGWEVKKKTLLNIILWIIKTELAVPL